MRDQTKQPVQHVYASQGGHTDQLLQCPDPDPHLARVPSIADRVPLTEIMSRNLTCARRDLDADTVAELMIANRIGCVPVVEEPGRPIGMITKQDFIEQVGTVDGSEITPRTAEELMMPLAITLPDTATIAQAAAMMASEDIHHVPIVDREGRLIGIVSSMDIVRWLARNDGFTA
ncbi:MAG TPA: CBS domain-containing protein [Kofleriaceae bacterium]|nr:CBS domain-containing protein [Kofleriaceae bacterium]